MQVNEVILVVEDDPWVRTAVSRSMESRGYKVLQAADGETALEMVREECGRIRVLVTDLLLPGIDGKSLAQQLSGMVPGLAVIIMSGYDRSVLARMKLSEDDHRFLSKPFSPDTLVRRVEQALADSQ